MPQDITIKPQKPFPQAQFQVMVSGNPSTQHQVFLEKQYYLHLTQEKITPVQLINHSFEFLLHREPNTSILNAFNLKVIQTYFPDYEQTIQNILASKT